MQLFRANWIWTWLVGKILQVMYHNSESISRNKIKSLLTLPNIQYIIQGLEVLLRNDLDGENRAKVIELRDQLLSHVGNVFSD